MSLTRSELKQIVDLAHSRGWGNGSVLAVALSEASKSRPLATEGDLLDAIPLSFSAANGDSRREVASAIASNVKFAELPAPPLDAASASVNLVLLTALPVESKAVIALLNQTGEVVHPLGSVYVVGSFEARKFSVSVAVVEVGQGNVAAAAEAERAIGYFSPDVVCFVGVAGGLKDDVQHGDVVVGEVVYDYMPGKEAGSKTLTRVRTFQAAAALVGRARVAARSEWVSPAGVTFSVYVKPIAAGPRVIASSTSPTAELIREVAGDALAVEMEGAGFMQAAFGHPKTLAMVVRGISDLVDDKSAESDRNWQPPAAANAARVALDVVGEYLSSRSEHG